MVLVLATSSASLVGPPRPSCHVKPGIRAWSRPCSLSDPPERTYHVRQRECLSQRRLSGQERQSNPKQDGARLHPWVMGVYGAASMGCSGVMLRNDSGMAQITWWSGYCTQQAEHATLTDALLGFMETCSVDPWEVHAAKPAPLQDLGKSSQAFPEAQEGFLVTPSRGGLRLPQGSCWQPTSYLHLHLVAPRLAT